MFYDRQKSVVRGMVVASSPSSRRMAVLDPVLQFCLVATLQSRLSCPGGLARSFGFPRQLQRSRHYLRHKTHHAGFRLAN
ncbi:hypothetical protein GDO78_016557 [Eleutherodactylus coqui]|uniref:Uncharacterized protein n=1 Tax=Eleutherodactylus coqui TaxID=57060 RepID=A0A8J6E806_ELECQ|nr:hypothetical protein GDO78_016557 [Eleutherodactylus coqui]